MTQTDIPLSAMEPFNVGRSSFRLLFDFGVMLSCFSSAPKKRVLDFGAGTGWISEFLARLGYEVYAIDVDRGTPGAGHSRSKETTAFIETYKKDDPTWIERDVVLDEIAQISKESGFSELVVLPTLLPGLKSYTASQWMKFRKGDPVLARGYINLLKDFN